MKRRMLIGFVVAVAFVQLAVPALMVSGHERTLREGEVFKFRTRPVDPYDAFRGRYVALSVDRMTVKADPSVMPRRAMKHVFATLMTDSNGYAVVSSVSERAPATGVYVRARAWRSGSEDVRVQLPIERFYLPDDEAPAAEAAYRQATMRGQQNAEVVVRVRNGDLVIEDVLIEGTPLREWMKEHENTEE